MASRHLLGWGCYLRMLKCITAIRSSLVFGRVAPALLLGIVFAAATGCSESNLTDERSPHYIKGIRHRRQSEYQDAAAAFEKCLRLSPESAEAHLQLGMLYEDHLYDPVKALYHFRAYANTRPDGENIGVAEQSVLRLERRLAEEWSGLYGMGNDAPATPAHVEQLTEEVEKLRQQKRVLLVKLREVHSELVALRQERENSKSVSRGAGLTEDGEMRGAPTETKDRVYTIRSGDSLFSIARREYGDGSLWEELRDYNQAALEGRKELIAGETIRIPDKESL